MDAGAAADAGVDAEVVVVEQSEEGAEAEAAGRLGAEVLLERGKAADALAALREKVEALAADGDPEAQRISLMWQ